MSGSKKPALDLVLPAGQIDAVNFVSLYTAALIGFAETRPCTETKPLGEWLPEFTVFLKERGNRNQERKGGAHRGVARR